MPAQAVEDEPRCTAYRVDPLKFVKPGLVIRIKGGAVGCLTPEAYASFVKSVQQGDTARAAELSRTRVCYAAPPEGATVKVIQIRASSKGYCDMQTTLYPDRGLGDSWTDVSMFDEVVAP